MVLRDGELKQYIAQKNDSHDESFFCWSGAKYLFYEIEIMARNPYDKYCRLENVIGDW